MSTQDTAPELVTDPYLLTTDDLIDITYCPTNSDADRTISVRVISVTGDGKLHRIKCAEPTARRPRFIRFSALESSTSVAYGLKTLSGNQRRLGYIERIERTGTAPDGIGYTIRYIDTAEPGTRLRVWPEDTPIDDRDADHAFGVFTKVDDRVWEHEADSTFAVTFNTHPSGTTMRHHDHDPIPVIAKSMLVPMDSRMDSPECAAMHAAFDLLEVNDSVVVNGVEATVQRQRGHHGHDDTFLLYQRGLTAERKERLIAELGYGSAKAAFHGRITRDVLGMQAYWTEQGGRGMVGHERVSRVESPRIVVR